MSSHRSREVHPCIYCGREAKKVRDGEHIIPQVIGGDLTLIDTAQNPDAVLVCHDCNNGPLSAVDRELCSRSPLAIVASQEMDAKLWMVWDVDHNSRNQLVEGRPQWDGAELKGLVTFPQIAFERDGPHVRCDMAEIEAFGRSNYINVFHKALRSSFGRWRNDKKRQSREMFFDRVDSDVRRDGNRLSPRFYFRKSIREIAADIDEQHATLRFLTDADKRFALRSLDNLSGSHTFGGWGQFRGSHMPRISSSFDVGETARGLLKLGVNVLAAYSTRTEVNVRTFRRVMREVTGATRLAVGRINEIGFVAAEKLAPLNRGRGNGHAFRLVYNEGQWLFYASFFGGRVGAAALFDGPNREEWQTLDVYAPLGSPDWIVTKSPIFQPLTVQVQWGDFGKLAPSIQMATSASGLVTEWVRLKHPRQRGLAIPKQTWREPTFGRGA